MNGINDLAARMPVPALPGARERKRLRLAFGVTQVQLARALGVSRQTVITYEKGGEPSGKFREDYAAVLNAWQETERQQREASCELIR